MGQSGTNGIKVLRNELGLSQEEFSGLLDTSPKNVSLWENDKAKPPPEAEKMLELWGEVARIVNGFGDDPSAWIRRKNPTLEYQRPLDLAGTFGGSREILAILKMAGRGVPL